MYLILLGSIALNEVWATSPSLSIDQYGCHGLASRLLVGNTQSQSYEVWDPDTSTVAIKTLVDRNSGNSRQIMMGAARIDTDLLFHQHAAAEIYYVTKGKARTLLGAPEDKRWVDLEAGNYLYLPSGLHHHTIADPDNPLEIIYIFPRDNLEDVEYVFDGGLPVLSRESVVGKLPTLDKYPTQLKRQVLVKRSEVGESGLMMEHLSMPARERVQDVASEANHIFLVRHGQGLMAIGDQKISIEEGSYLYLEEGTPYSIQSAREQGLDILIFKRQEEKL